MAPDQRPVAAPVVVARMLIEIRDAVRELRITMPDSVLVDLAEQKIDMIERRNNAGEDDGKAARFGCIPQSRRS